MLSFAASLRFVVAFPPQSSAFFATFCYFFSLRWIFSLGRGVAEEGGEEHSGGGEVSWRSPVLPVLAQYAIIYSKGKQNEFSFDMILHTMIADGKQNEFAADMTLHTIIALIRRKASSSLCDDGTKGDTSTRMAEASKFQSFMIFGTSICNF